MVAVAVVAVLWCGRTTGQRGGNVAMKSPPDTPPSGAAYRDNANGWRARVFREHGVPWQSSAGRETRRRGGPRLSMLTLRVSMAPVAIASARLCWGREVDLEHRLVGSAGLNACARCKDGEQERHRAPILLLAPAHNSSHQSRPRGGLDGVDLGDEAGGLEQRPARTRRSCLPWRRRRRPTAAEAGPGLAGADHAGGGPHCRHHCVHARGHRSRTGDSLRRTSSYRRTPMDDRSPAASASAMPGPARSPR